MKIIKGDIHKVIKELPSNEYDLLYTNPPFNGLTKASWDKILNWNELWEDIWRVMKPNGVVILHSTQRFTIELCGSCLNHFKYKMVWKKNNSTGFLSSKYQPLRECEDICVFYKKSGIYNPQMRGNDYHIKRNVKFGGGQKYWGEGNKKENEYQRDEGHFGRFPTDFLEYPIKKGNGAGTRCNELIEYIIKTYSNEKSKVLDITCYDAITGVICDKLKRQYTGIDLNPTY